MTPDAPHALDRVVVDDGDKPAEGGAPEEAAPDARPRRLHPSPRNADFEHALRLQMAVITGE